MNNTPQKPSLIRDTGKPIGFLGTTAIFLAPQNLAPFNPDAILEEQDTALLMREPDPGLILDNPNKPLWYFAHKLTQAENIKVGTVRIQSKHTPPIIQLILHDFEQEPSSSPVWINTSLQQLFNTLETKQWLKLNFPICQSQVNALAYINKDSFILSFLEKVANSRTLDRLWFSGTPDKLGIIQQHLTRTFWPEA